MGLVGSRNCKRIGDGTAQGNRDPDHRLKLGSRRGRAKGEAEAGCSHIGYSGGWDGGTQSVEDSEDIDDLLGDGTGDGGQVARGGQTHA